MPIVHYAEVPGHITYQPTEQNGVHVVGGSNWDISRSAVETPITPLPLYSQDGNSGKNSANSGTTTSTVKKTIKKRRAVKAVKHKKILTRKDCACALDK